MRRSGDATGYLPLFCPSFLSTMMHLGMSFGNWFFCIRSHEVNPRRQFPPLIFMLRLITSCRELVLRYKLYFFLPGPDVLHIFPPDRRMGRPGLAGSRPPPVLMPKIKTSTRFGTCRSRPPGVSPAPRPSPFFPNPPFRIRSPYCDL